MIKLVVPNIFRAKRSFLYALIAGVSSLLVVFFVVYPFNVKKGLPISYANDTTCPADYTLEQCYTYLEQQKSNIAKERKALQKKLGSYSAEASSIYATLQHINNEIKDLELQEKEINLKIELSSLKITDYTNKVNEIQGKIENYQQEVQRIKEKMKSTFALKYAMSSVPWYYYLAKGDVYSFFEMLELYKYYINTGEGQVAYYKLLAEQIKTQLNILNLEKQKIIKTRNDIEAENKELSKLKNTLDAKKQEQQGTLARIQRNEAEVKKRMAQLKAAQNQADRALTAVLMQMWESGNLPGNGTWVGKGTVIGYQGHTGCSFGSHLHFAVYLHGHSVRPSTNGYLRISGGYLLSGNAIAPEASALITQGYHEGYALDMVSLSQGLHNGSRYCKNKYSIKCPSYVYGTSWFKSLPSTACFNQTGEGAPVRSILGGTLRRGRDHFGSNYAIVDHGNGLVTIYYHLK